MGNQRITARSLFFPFALSFTAGIALRSFADVPVSFLFAALFLFFILLFFAWHTHDKRVLLVSLCLLGSIAGMARFAVSSFDTGSPILATRVGTATIMEGVIVEEPDRRETTTRLTVRIEKMLGDDATLKDTLLVATEPYPEWEYGDRVMVRGKIERPEPFANDTGRVFDYAAHLSVKGIYYTASFATVSLVAKGEGNRVRLALFKLKQGFIDNLNALIKEPESSLLAGLVVGAKQSLGTVLLDDFRRAGLIHIVVLSGYNLTIVADSIAASLRFFRPMLSASLSGLGIVLFAVMVGGSATVVRASIMALLVILARRLGREYDVTTALVFAGFLMLLHNPKILAFDASFQLSFLATIGLIYFSPLVEPYLKRFPERFGLRDVAVATLATQLFVLPFIIYSIGEWSAVALPVNLLVLLFIPATMLLGFFAGALGFISYALAYPFALLVSLLLSYELFVATWFAKFPFASFAVPPVPFFIVAAAYAAYGYMIYKKHKSR